ncbi:MAG: hypothetical protein FWD73_13395 [Polyangiaceae bacterium]|nr:hypothetical protein [Polyangiaceae bacterium]
MTKEALVSAVKQIVATARSGNVEASFDGYRHLFEQPWFTSNRPEDQRQALKLFVLAKRSGRPSSNLIEAYRAAIAPLTELVSTHEEPEDFEMLGICHLVVGNEEAASNLFRRGLTIERTRNPASDLCGRLMTRVASI